MDRIAPDDRKAVAGRVDARLRGEPTPATVEFEGLREHGSRFWIEATGTAVEWEGAARPRSWPSSISPSGSASKIGGRPELDRHFEHTERAVQRIADMISHMTRITRLAPLADLNSGRVETLDLRRSSGPAPDPGPTGPKR